VRVGKSLVVIAVVASFAIAGVALALLLPDVLDGPDVAANTPAPDDAVPVDDAGLVTWRSVALWFGAWLVVGGVGLSGLACKLARRRLRLRLERDYGLYELHLSMHDEAKAQDLEDMVEAIGNVVRAFPEQRARSGQPFVALECHYGTGASGLEWAICVRCETDAVTAIEAAFQNAYPDVRIGHTHEDDPQPIAGNLRTPGHVLRFRKARSFIYPISTEGDKLSSPPLEAIAQQQVAVGCQSSVRIQLIPAMESAQRWARHKFEQRENHLLRSERWGLPEAGTRSVLHSEELRDSRRTQNRGLFFMEVQVAADSRANANRIAAAVTARRGENHLHRRWMTLRGDLYRRRFPTAYPPLLPSIGWGTWPSIVSAAEVAYLLELRRFPVPRLPAPPEAARASGDLDVPLPPPDPADDHAGADLGDATAAPA